MRNLFFLKRNNHSGGDRIAEETASSKDAAKIFHQCEVVITWVQDTSDA